MEHAPTTPSLRQVQAPPRNRKRVKTLHIRRIKLAGGRLEYRIPSAVDRGSYAQLWCDKSARKATEQRLTDEYAGRQDNPVRVKFYSLK